MYTPDIIIHPEKILKNPEDGLTFLSGKLAENYFGKNPSTEDVRKVHLWSRLPAPLCNMFKTPADLTQKNIFNALQHEHCAEYNVQWELIRMLEALEKLLNRL